MKKWTISVPLELVFVRVPINTCTHAHTHIPCLVVIGREIKLGKGLENANLDHVVL